MSPPRTAPRGESGGTRVDGHVSGHPRGFGFLKLREDQPTQSAFVAPPDLNLFMAGDLVSARLVVQQDGRYMADNLKMVQMGQKTVFGTVVEHRGLPYLSVDRQVSNTDWRIEGGEGLQKGDHIVARRADDHVVVVRSVASTDAALHRILVRYNIRAEDTDQLIEEHAPDWSGVRDLCEMPTLTIDDDSSMDLDDALSVHPAAPDGALRLFVHIADVDALVPEDSPLDVEARARGTSVYLAGHVIPMLPRALSEDRLSLLPGQERAVLTAELRIDPEGQVTSVDLYRSRIRSDVRLNYHQVSRFLDGHPSDIPEVVKPTMRLLRAVGARLAVARARRGGIRILGEEAYITVDGDSKEPTHIEGRVSNSAHDLVERLMVAANETVAAWLVERGLPGVFRVHDEPDDQRVETLAASAEHFGFAPVLASPLTPLGLAAFEAQFDGTVHEVVMRTVMTRVLGPARYTVEPSLHFGLAAPLYVHFTSPIRRYADLAVHRIIKAYVDGHRGTHAGDPQIEALAQSLNDCAYRATKAERDWKTTMAARLFASKLGDRYSGTIVAVKTFGLVIELSGTGVTGTIAMDDLPGGPFRVDRARQRLEGPSRSFGIGAELAVEVAGADETLGRIELRLTA
ncbi:MAG: RNB domain-containing ribonuclease [Myxococcota bacterium]